MKLCLSCHSPKTEGTTDRCASCNLAIRRAEREAMKPKKVQHTIRKRSVKEADRMKEYNKVRAEYLATHQQCEIRLLGCVGMATEIHHAAKRIGDNLTNTEHLLATCWRCHRTTETVLSAKERRDKKLLV